MKTTAFCHECNSPVTVEDDSGPNPPCPACGARLKELDAYPVFISFAKPELKIAREVAAGLSEKGVRCWVAPDRLGVGAHYRAEIAKALRASKVVVLILSNAAAASDWVYKEIVYADSVRKPIFPFRVERVELSDDWALMLGNTQREDAFYEPLGRHIDRLASRVYATLHELSAPSAPKKPDAEREGAGQAEPRPALLGVNPHASPYAGPEPFSDKMLERFFGRDKDAELLIERLNASRAVLVYAPSGAGKSSLLNTKIKRALERTGHDVLLGARVGGPLPEKAPAEEVRNIYTFSAVCGLGSGVTPGPGINLADYLRLVDRRPGTRGRVLVFDQFEELFTQHADYPEHRKGFFEDLVEALEDDPALRLIFSMRQEYLADYEPLEEKFLTEFDPARFRLGRIEADGALEAIIRPAEPYAEFAEGVAEQIVDRLNTNKVRRSDGAVVSKRAEFIEMVHLQVVCTRLWERLPPGITRIEMGHVARAGGEGRTFDEFVANALDAFYEETVKEVSDSPEATRNGGFPKELIRLGCMKFVTPASTRTMVKRTSGRTGRLPDWVVKQLEDKHLLRHERRGEEEWYELAHDRLVEPVGRQMDQDVKAMLYATDLLDRMIEKAGEERGGSLDGYFSPHGEILKVCNRFHRQAGLFEDETEFIFRASLSVGRQMREWSDRMAEDYPEARLRVLLDALRAEGADRDAVRARRNAAALVGEEKMTALSPELRRLVLSDPSLRVRRAAALSLAQLDGAELYKRFRERPDDAELYKELTDKLGAPGTRADALRALSLVRVAADREEEKAEVFESCFARLPRRERWKIRRLAWAHRLREGMPVILFIGLLGGGSSAVVALVFKFLLGVLGWGLNRALDLKQTFALAQAEPSIGASAFHGLTAGFIWAGSITLGLALHHLVFGRRHAPKSYLRPYGAIVSGVLSGLLSSLVIVLVIVSVFSPDSLVRMAWVSSLSAAKHRLTLGFARELFVETRFGCLYLIAGVGLGVGMALMANGLRAWKVWGEFVQRPRAKLSGFDRTKKLAADISRLALRRAWPLPLMLALAVTAASFVPRVPKATGEYCVSNLTRASSDELCPTASVNEYHNGKLHALMGLVGDCTAQVFGGFFGMVGMGLGIIIVLYGFELEARKKW